ncbi:hypothetical protein JXO52_08110 [bacterium]|nr:hypothetical protein [bacterium]
MLVAIGGAGGYGARHTFEPRYVPEIGWIAAAAVDDSRLLKEGCTSMVGQYIVAFDEDTPAGEKKAFDNG